MHRLPFCAWISQILCYYWVRIGKAYSNISIWSIDRTQSGATTLSQSESGSNTNEEVLCVPQSSSVAGTLQSDYLVSY